MQTRVILRLPSALIEACVAEAKKYEPLESGGVFMGYWADPSSVVVTALVGAGPNADRGLWHFAPDHDWQTQEIAREYEASGRKCTYLGDWHSHPGAQHGVLSRRDRRVLRQIIDTPAARAPRPVMAIVHGSQAQGQAMTAWVAEAKSRPLLWPRLLVTECVLRVF